MTGYELKTDAIIETGAVRVRAAVKLRRPAARCFYGKEAAGEDHRADRYYAGYGKSGA